MSFANDAKDDREFTVLLPPSALELICRFQMGDSVVVNRELASRGGCVSYPLYSYIREDHKEAVVKAGLQGCVIDVGGSTIEVDFYFSMGKQSKDSKNDKDYWHIPLYISLTGIFLEHF